MVIFCNCGFNALYKVAVLIQYAFVHTTQYHLVGAIGRYIIWNQFEMGRRVYYDNNEAHVTNLKTDELHYNDVIMSAMSSQITSLTIVYSNIHSGAHQRKHQSSASLAFHFFFHLMTSSCHRQTTKLSNTVKHGHGAATDTETEILSFWQNFHHYLHRKLLFCHFWVLYMCGTYLNVKNEFVKTMLHMFSLQWRHNEDDDVSSHRRLDCLLNRLFKRRSKKTSKLRITGLCEGNSPVTGDFPAQRSSNAETVSIWWRHHVS